MTFPFLLRWTGLAAAAAAVVFVVRGSSAHECLVLAVAGLAFVQGSR